MQDNALLTQYAQNNSEAAFSQLLARHLPLVLRTCRRELASDMLAEDAAQVVFLLLARKAGTLRAGPSLAGWLYQASVFVAKDVRKQEARRIRREEAVMQETIHAQTAPASEWNIIEPHLNAALSALKPTDRDAVLLRFLEGHTLAETGRLLAISEDAARMRCARALDKLRRYLTTHGAAVTGVALAALLTTEAARPVSAQSASAMTQGTLQALANSPTPNILLLSKGISHTMKIIKIKYAALAAGLALVGTSVSPLVHVLYAQAPPVVSAAHPQLTKKRTTEPQQVSITLALARVSEADLKVSGINYDLVPVGTSSQKMYRFYATGRKMYRFYATGTRASHFFQKLSAQRVVTEAPTVTTVDDVTATISISTSLPTGKVIAQQLIVTPHINANNSVTLVLHSVFEDNVGKRELNTTRTIKNRDTMAILMPNVSGQPVGEYLVYFVTPTVK